MTAAYRTLEAAESHEIEKVRGSRFIAHVAPFRGETELSDHLRRLRERFPDANHHCWAWRETDRFRYSDDGEPSGSAGRPILQQIDGKSLLHAQVIVTRIFGGTKLGVGGLVRAYGGAAGAALDQAAVIEVIPTIRWRLTYDYGLSSVVEGTLAAHGLTPVAVDFAERVTSEVEVTEERSDAFVAEIRERSAGRIDPAPCGED